MRKIKEVLRLNHEHGLGQRAIARSCGIAQSTVVDYLQRAHAAGLSWPLPPELSESELEERLFTRSAAVSAAKPLPDCETIHGELRRHRKVNLTLTQLWLEYKEIHPDGYEYTQFCEYYRRWRGKLDYVMRQEHRAGEKVFVDYCEGLSLIDPQTGEAIATNLFVAVWGASNYTFAEASLTQTLPHWTLSHRRAFEYFGCVPHVLVPDNLKSGVQKACFYEPEINRSYAELAAHYGCAVLPARPAKPRDKAKVEAGVLVAQRWILAVLRHRTFFSIAELNAAIAVLLERLNTRNLRKVKKSRRELFESTDRPNAKLLPERPYEYADWKKARVNIDYHIELERHYYSVPFRLLHEEVESRLTAATVEVFYKHERVACHARSYVVHTPTTLKEHMPPAHQQHLEWTPSRLVEWAAKTGPATALVVERILSSRAHPEQGYRACLGILRRLVTHYGGKRVEAASDRALKFNACGFRSMRSILERGLDRQTQAEETQQTVLPFHENVRGGEYYH